jgi:hypothetical protein
MRSAILAQPPSPIECWQAYPLRVPLPSWHRRRHQPHAKRPCGGSFTGDSAGVDGQAALRISASGTACYSRFQLPTLHWLFRTVLRETVSFANMAGGAVTVGFQDPVGFSGFNPLFIAAKESNVGAMDLNSWQDDKRLVAASPSCC